MSRNWNRDRGRKGTETASAGLRLEPHPIPSQEVTCRAFVGSSDAEFGKPPLWGLTLTLNAKGTLPVKHNEAVMLQLVVPLTNLASAGAASAKFLCRIALG